MDTNETTPAPAPMLEMSTSRQMLSWLAEQKLSIAFTTYQVGKLYFIGLKPDNVLSVFERSFNRCMGLCTTQNGLYMSSLYQVWRFENVFEAGQQQDGFDRLYVPQMGYTTGDLDIHDMAVDSDGRLVFVNTLFGCVATLSETHSFKPIWQPFFISKLAAEDRCHLNGLAMRDGQPAYVTAVGQCDVADGWREHRTGGGIVIDVQRNEVVCGGLSMPHSPRWHDGRLWVCDSGSGGLGYVDPVTRAYIRIAELPGFTRGLDFVGNLAFVGLSQVRESAVFSGIPIADRPVEERRCGVWVVDINTGETIAYLQFEDALQEIFAVQALPGIRFPDLANNDPQLIADSFVLPDQALRQVPAELRSFAS